MLVFTAAAYDKPVQNTIEIDESLFERIARGESGAFTELYVLCKDAVYSYALSMLRNPDDADDVTSDVFLKIRCAAHLYKPKGKPLAWIFTIARNVCLMKWRKDKRVIELSDEALNNLRALDKIEDAEDRIVLRAALRVLNKDELSAVLLHAVSGMKHTEVASLLGIPLSTALSRYNRGIKKLRKELETAL